MSDKRLYVRVRGRVIGPFSRAQLKALRERGQFHRFHEVSEDRKQWVSAATLEELFTGAAEGALVMEPAATQGRAEPASAPAAEWYYVDDKGNQAGPVAAEQLLGFARAGTVKGETLVWKEGLANWTTLADTGLLAGLPPSGGGQPSRRGDGLAALKGFALDPVGGLPALCEALGNSGSLALGLVFGVVFDLCFVIGIMLFVLESGGGPKIPINFGNGIFFGNGAQPLLVVEIPTSDKILFLWKLALVAVLPLASLTVAITFIRGLAKGRGCIGYDVLISGATLLPWGIFWTMLPLIGIRNWELLGFLLLLWFLLGVLILNSGFTRVLNLSDRSAIVAVPATILITIFVFFAVLIRITVP